MEIKIRHNINTVTGALLILASTSASANLITYQQGFNSYSGTSTIEISSGQPDSNTLGSGTARASVDVFNTSSLQETQALIRFDDIFGSGGLPASGITINSATLQFWTKSFSPGVVSIHMMNTDWNSATTWNSLGGDGITGDIAAADDSKTNLTDEANVTFDVTSSLTAWATGTASFGWGFMNTSDDGWDFNTELYSGSSPWDVRRPLLTVDYSILNAPELATLVLMGIGLAGIGLRRRLSTK